MKCIVFNSQFSPRSPGGPEAGDEFVVVAEVLLNLLTHVEYGAVTAGKEDVKRVSINDYLYFHLYISII